VVAVGAAVVAGEYPCVLLISPARDRGQPVGSDAMPHLPRVEAPTQPSGELPHRDAQQHDPDDERDHPRVSDDRPDHQHQEHKTTEAAPSSRCSVQIRCFASRFAGTARTSARDKGDAMSTGRESPSPGEGTVTAEDVVLAERRASEARQRAAYAGLSAARSMEESARYHEQFAKVQDQSVRQGVSDTAVHRRSATLHRQAAADDRDLAERKRKESEADLAPATNQ
jgi:hypothetical protein